MANTKSAKQEILVNRRNHRRNQHYKSRLKSAIKSALAAIESKAKDSDDIVRSALRLIDKTASKGVIHRNAAARKKSRLAIAVKGSLKQTAAAPAKKTAKKSATTKAASTKTTATKSAASKTTAAKPKATKTAAAKTAAKK